MPDLSAEYLKEKYASLRDESDDQLVAVLGKLKKDWITTTAELEKVSRNTLLKKEYAIVFVDAVKPEQCGNNLATCATNRSNDQTSSGHLKKRTGGAIDGEPFPLKRKLTEQAEEFFAFMPKGSFDDPPGSPGMRVLKFSKRIVDTENQSILERRCFEPLATKVKMLSERDNFGKRNQSGIIITGSSGIGKTFFGFYFAHRLINDGKIVAFNYRNKFRVLFAPPLSALQGGTEENAEHRFLLDLLNEYQGGNLAPLEGNKPKQMAAALGDSPHFWGMAEKDDVVWTRVLENHRTWLLVDLHSGDQYEDGRRACKIVVTSTLRHGNCPDLDSGGDLISKKLYMGPLSLGEAKNIAGAVNTEISPDEVEERFKAVGGSARLLFNTPGQAKQKLDEAFGMPARQMLDPSGENPTMASTLVHILANDDFEQVGRKFASQEIANRCVDAGIGNKELETEIGNFRKD